MSQSTHSYNHLMKFSPFVPSLLLATVCACTESNVPETALPEAGVPIRWHVESDEGMMDSRAMIEGGNGKSADEVLQEACTPGLGGQSIGIWADLDGGESTLYNIFADVELIYQDKEGGNPDSYWNYPGEPLIWENYGVYRFRAYYPRSIKDYVLSTSNATTFVIEEYNTASMQEDVLVAYKRVNTTFDNLYIPVELNMQHALSALQFRFRFSKGYEDTDHLTSFWLQNGATRDFANVGLLIYGTADNPNQINWQEAYQPLASQRMYYWENSGLLFDSHTGSTDTVAVAYMPAGTTAGQEYTRNNGNILIIPQTSDGTVNLCFTTRNGGNTVYRVPIPKETGTGINRSQFLPGYRYVYTITITETNLRVDLSIAPWNLLKSSFAIDLNV